MSSVKLRKIIGAGNPLLDISTVLPDNDNALLKKYNLDENNAILADDSHIPLYKQLKEEMSVDYLPGGATLNSVRVAQWLLEIPGATSYVGSVGGDEDGRTLKEQAQKYGVDVHFHEDKTHPTGTCAVLINGPDQVNRSMVANLAAANHFKIDHINKPEVLEKLEEASIIYSAGFFLTVSPETMLKMATSSLDKTYSINLSAPFLIEFFKDQMMSVMPYVDIIFGNESEALLFAKVHDFGTEDIKLIAKRLSDLPKAAGKTPGRLAVITQGSLPTVVASAAGVVEYPVCEIPKAELVDTNGAGDAFVGGYLSALARSKPVDTCIACGHYAAGVIIRRSGCTYPEKAAFQF